MRRRTSKNTTALILTGLLGCAAITAGVVPLAAAGQPAPVAVAAERPAAGPTLVEVQDRLSTLEAAADRVGLVSQQADEALLQHDTAANRAAADRARAALVSLASAQTPELTALADRATALGVSTTAIEGDGTTATTTALVGRTRAFRAVSYARTKIGDPYGYASAGPGRWDCSGLTMKSYSAVKVSIGGHSATAQYKRARAEHRLYSYAKRQVGDLIFYGTPGSVYHVAIYSGHNRMVEAPYPGKRVREVPVRSAGRLAQVARPA